MFISNYVDMNYERIQDLKNYEQSLIIKGIYKPPEVKCLIDRAKTKDKYMGIKDPHICPLLNRTELGKGKAQDET